MHLQAGFGVQSAVLRCFFHTSILRLLFCKQKRPVTLRSSRSQNYRPVCRIQFCFLSKTLSVFTNFQRISCAALRILLGFIQIVPCSTAVFYPAYPLHNFSSFPALIRVKPSTTSASPSVVALQRLICAKPVFNRREIEKHFKFCFEVPFLREWSIRDSNS